MAQGRPAQDDLAGVARHAIGQIRLAARDERDVTVEPARIVEDVGEHRSDDARVGAGRDPLEPLRGRIVEVELLRGGHTATRDAAAARARPISPLVMGGVTELLLAHDDPPQEPVGGVLLGERDPAEHLDRTVRDLARRA